MSNLAWLIVIVLCLTAVGILTFVLMVKKYYWGERGTPPPSREERQRLKEQRMREEGK